MKSKYFVYFARFVEPRSPEGIQSQTEEHIRLVRALSEEVQLLSRNKQLFMLKMKRCMDVACVWLLKISVNCVHVLTQK